MIFGLKAVFWVAKICFKEEMPRIGRVRPRKAEAVKTAMQPMQQRSQILKGVNMSVIRWVGVITVAIVLSGCAATRDVIQHGSISAGTYRTAALVPKEGNSPEVDGYIMDALAGHGISMLMPKSPGTTKAEDVDLLVSYSDVWRWDLTTYLKSLRIDLFDARTGTLLVSGSWKNSFFHGFQRGKDEAKELLDDMIPRIRGAGK